MAAKTIPKPLIFSHEETAATDKLIQELLRKNAIVECQREYGDYVSNIFLRQKPNGSYGMILNHKNFNWYVNYQHFKMDMLIQILYLIVKDCYLMSLDLSDAYLSIFMSLASQSVLKFQWRDKFYKFLAMPFGLTEAPRKFTKLVKCPLSVVRQAGFTIAAYLDDFLQCELTYDMCNRALQFTYNLIVSLGFLPNFEKSSFIPSQCITMLGHIIDSKLMIIYLPKDKSYKIVALCYSSLFSPTMQIRQLCCLIGKLISCFVAHPLGHLHYCSLERVKVKALKVHKGNFGKSCTLDNPSMLDLCWWCSSLPTAAAPINRGCASIVFTCDASKKGWSACFNGMKANGQFTLEEF